MTDLITIPLSQGREAVIDASDLPLVQSYTWSAQYSPCTKGFYAVTYAPKRNGKRKRIAMHRLLTNPPEGFEVDHINGDGLDNRRSNLRIATRFQNAMNRGPNSRNRSGFKGVTRYKKTGKWQAQIKIHGALRHLGYFSTPEAAALAYDSAAFDYAGEFAYLNFPEEVRR